MTNPPLIWEARGRRLDLTRRALVMGILNTTPDSFSDGGSFEETEPALRHARDMISEGADIIDVGGESTRPGAEAVGVDEEIARTVPVIERLRGEWDGLISIDTSKAAVAAEALAAGADIVNDVTGLRGDVAMAEVCRESGAGVVVMHMQGQPRTMQEHPEYNDVVVEVRSFFETRHRELVELGLREGCLVFDPGIGFGKSQDHNLLLLRRLDQLSPGGRPLLIGLSRKSFLGKAMGSPDLALRSWPTVALTAYTRSKGARIHRVHEVGPNREALRMAEAIMDGGQIS
ncbi:MAG: dihydropteroate synthase [Akkermansiaceae bacterium]|nr:dihydropteroate synthase [Akkermansiaceae bacterium]